jgi:hypothetical protein
MVDGDYQRLAAYLIDLGFQEVHHYWGGGPTLLAHSLGVYHFMRAQHCSEELCRAGLFHQIYGVEGVPVFQLSLECRDEVAALIGERSERLTYFNCAMDRTSFDRALERATPPYRFTDRFTGHEIELGSEDFDDLCRVQLYAWLEQVARVRNWDYRRTIYQDMAKRLGTAAQEAYVSVYAEESAGMEASQTGSSSVRDSH